MSHVVLFFLLQVKAMKRLVEDRVLLQMEKERVIVNETADKVDTVQQKVATIERHLPVMIQEILEFYFEKRVSDLLAKFVSKEDHGKALSLKLDN